MPPSPSPSQRRLLTPASGKKHTCAQEDGAEFLLVGVKPTSGPLSHGDAARIYEFTA